MAIHPDFPKSPYAPLLAKHRWFPADEALRASAYERLFEVCELMGIATEQATAIGDGANDLPMVPAPACRSRPQARGARAGDDLDDAGLARRDDQTHEV
jgi:hypothetical protein